MVKLSRSALYQAMTEGDFPKPIRVGKRAVRWIEDEIAAWMETRERGGPAGPAA